MIKKIWLTIVNFYWSIRYPEWTDVQVKALFDSLNDHYDLVLYLKNNSFVWNSDGMNFSKEMDTFERPSQVLARKFANCSGFLRLFAEYIKYKRCADRTEEYVLYNDDILFGKWHYITYIYANGEKYIQNNMNIVLATPEEIEKVKSGFKYMELIDSWER